MVRFTNKNKRNAYGKCVSATAKTKAKKREAADKTDVPAEAKATGTYGTMGRGGRPLLLRSCTSGSRTASG